jgi:hypothetical protein
MANLAVVYRHGSVDGDVVARQEIESPAELPSLDETITLPGKVSKRQFVVTSRLPPTASSADGAAIRSAFTIVLKDAR